MRNEHKAQLEEQLGLLETKVERAYDVSEKKETELVTKKIQEMSSKIKEILLLSVTDEQKGFWEKVIDTIDIEIKELIIHLIKTWRKQEKQETMYNISHLYSKTLEQLIEEVESLKTACIAHARSCVVPIDNAFKEVEQMYLENLNDMVSDASEQVLTKITYEIRRCGIEIQAIHSEQTYAIENSITLNVEKMSKNLEQIKQKGQTESKHIKIKGGVTNSQSGKYTLSDIISAKEEVVTDIPKRSSLDDFFV